MKKLNKVLFYVSPFHSHGMPLDLALGAVDKLFHMSKALRASGVTVDIFSSDSAINLMRSKRTTVFEHCHSVLPVPDEIFSSLGGGNMELAAQVFDAVAPPLRDPLDERHKFERFGVNDSYEIVLSFFSETSFLKHIFPSARVLFFETGVICHLPFQQFHSFDPVGSLAKNSYIGSVDREELLARAHELYEYRPLLDKIRSGIGRFSAKYYSGLSDLHGLRSKWKKVYLAVSQPMGRSKNSKVFPGGFEFIEYLLNCVPASSAVLVTEHPNFPRLTAEQHRYLKSKYSNYVYSPALQAIYSPSAICLPLADAVIGISSTVLLQAHALGIKTYSLGEGAFGRLNGFDDLESFISSVETDGFFESRELEILDLIARYSVPMAMYQSNWLSSYLERLLSCSKDSLPCIAAPDVLIAYYDTKEFPEKLTKPVDYFQKHWREAPLALAEPWSIHTNEMPEQPKSQKDKRVVATVLDHYAIGGTQNVIRRLVGLLPDVHWVLFVERRTPHEFPILSNCELIEIGSIGDTEIEAERKLTKAVYDFHKTTHIDVFVNPMHWRPATLKAMRMIKEIVGIPTIYWEHNSFFFPMYTARPELHELREEVASVVDRVILLSDYDCWHFASYYPSSKYQVIHNPVPVIAAAESLSLDKDKSVLIVGRFDPQKRMDRIPEIAELFLSKHPEWSFTVLGDGYLRERVEAEVAKTSVAARVNFLGHVPDPSPFFKTSAVFASISDYEGDPLTFLEAKANGLPIVAFELFQNTKVRDGIDGFYVPQGDAETFSEKLSILAEDSSLRHSMAIEGYNHFLSFDNNEISEQWRSLIESLVAGEQFQPKSIAPPSVETLQREAVHVATSMHKVMADRITQLRLKTQPHTAQNKSKESHSTRPAPIKEVAFNLSQALSEAMKCMDKGAYEKAIEIYSECADKMPQNANIKRLFAEALLGAGNNTAAIRQLRLAQEIKPGNRQLKNRLLRLAYPKLYFWLPDKPFKG